MGNEVANQQGTTGLSFAVPAHVLAARAARGGGNIAPPVTTNSLTFAGKEWAITVNGERKVLDRPAIVQVGSEWKPHPTLREKLQIINVVVVDQSKRGRDFYAKEYDPANPTGPDCWSDDSNKPHSSVAAPQCKSCGVCPNAAPGSRATAQNPKATACKGFKLLAVQPVKDGTVNHDFPVLRLKLRGGSIWDSRDEESVAQGWYGWDNYAKFLAANGVSFSGEMITTMRFASTEHPQIQFGRGDWLETEDCEKVFTRSKTEEVQKLLAGFAATPRASAPEGKPLPQDDYPADVQRPDPVFSQSGAAAQAAQEAESARLKTEAYEADLARLVAQEAEAKKAQAEAEAKAEAKAAKIAEAKRLIAEAEAEAVAEEVGRVIDATFDEPAPTAPVAPPPPVVSAPVKEAAPPKRNTKKAAEPAPPMQIAEVPEALTGILDAWA